VKADEISVVDPTQPLRLALPRNKKKGGGDCGFCPRLSFCETIKDGIIESKAIPKKGNWYDF